ncbi:dihydrofolate reductase family protein [Paenibacillus radicis (ex Gao et al. 2016)]|uniref:Bacterial bifunctional deaminase-reductase C-terminal domain-containing protein n=1 Tax=Paenibacillus radicis (ex Gao et al. 2016) TaxID=1737354 RepID=A0A917HP00_9BACL|nr:dihydrofolate reductase family protein [Paenibacillus radicis (ex Gao et al. 2016)]GGG85854.1 hypothetical protein GCM10010918_49910 [Paenibacillus radicis (ex Gao et al. 2016)]
MKTILWAGLSANGNYSQSDYDHAPSEAALYNFGEFVKEAGNYIVGRRTFEALLRNQPAPSSKDNAADPFAGIDIVVISRNFQELPGVKIVATPQQAIAYLQEKGHSTALLAGGVTLHNTFLEAGLVDELILNISPLLEGKGVNLLLNQERPEHKEIKLLDFKSIGSDIIQLRYAINPA